MATKLPPPGSPGGKNIKMWVQFSVLAWSILTDWSVKYLSSMRGGSQAMREKFGAVAEVSARQIQTKVQLEPISCTVQCSGHSEQFSLQCREIIDACVTRGQTVYLGGSEEGVTKHLIL